MTDQVQMQNDAGQWVPAIPEPWFLGRKRSGRVRCGCGQKSRSIQRYREHYAYEHILMGRPEITS